MDLIAGIFPPTLYLSGLSFIVLVIFYLPFVVIFAIKIIKSKGSTPSRIAKLMLFLVIAYAIPLGDVTYYSYAMAKQCPKAGLHVYKQVHVDGYYSDILTHRGAEDLLIKDKFKFVEGTDYINGKKEFVRYEIENNKIATKIITEPIAEYEIILDNPKNNFIDRVQEHKGYIRNRRTNEIIADDIRINPFLGWMDRYFLGALFESTILGCGHGYKTLWDVKVLLPN